MFYKTTRTQLSLPVHRVEHRASKQRVDTFCPLATTLRFQDKRIVDGCVHCLAHYKTSRAWR